MNARILTTAAMVTALCGVLPARAADSQLMGLIMPDAKVIAGVNVDQAKVSPFGLWVLGQMQTGGKDLQQLTAATGFDPTRDVHEILVGSASVGGQDHSGLVVARGNFDASKINALATTSGATSETYPAVGGVTIIEDQKQTGGFAILSPTLAVAGDLANVKAAIDRFLQPPSSSLPAAIGVQVQHWSSSQDAWVITTVPPSTLTPAAGMPPIPGIGMKGQNNAFQSIQSLAGGVKFGANVVVTGQAVAGSAQDATQMGDAIKLLASLAMMQQNVDPNLQTVVKSLQVNASGNNLNLSLSVPQDTLVQVMKSGANRPAAKRPAIKK